MTLGTEVKDPADTADYTVNWALWLATAETISSVAWTVPTGITNSATTNTTTTATIRLTGGTADTEYTIACKVTTSAGQIAERSFTVRVANL